MTRFWMLLLLLSNFVLPTSAAFCEELTFEEIKSGLESSSFPVKINACRAAEKLGKQSKPLARLLLDAFFELDLYWDKNEKFISDPKVTQNKMKEIEGKVRELVELRKASGAALKSMGVEGNEVADTLMQKLEQSDSIDVADVLFSIVPDRRHDIDQILVKKSCLTVFNFQKQFKTQDQDGNGIEDYTVKTNGKGSLADKGEIQVGNDELYAFFGQETAPEPVHGYLFKMLEGQNSEMLGGKISYSENGRMTRGFGFVAFPAEYPKSGKLTYILGFDGKSQYFFSKDLGASTRTLAEKMRELAPDHTWTKESLPVLKR